MKSDIVFFYADAYSITLNCGTFYVNIEHTNKYYSLTILTNRKLSKIFLTNFKIIAVLNYFSLKTGCKSIRKSVNGILKLES